MPGIEPVFPALAGRFFTTEPSGKPSMQNFKKIYQIKKKHSDFLPVDFSPMLSSKQLELSFGVLE